MSTSYESARLILELYELRREATLREARAWFIREFNPDTVDDVVAALAGEHNPHLRMVVGYWDMAASLVTHGAVDRQMFLDANFEIVSTFSKFEHLLDELRRRRGVPEFARHMEDLVRSIPGIEERLSQLRERYRALSSGGGR